MGSIDFQYRAGEKKYEVHVAVAKTAQRHPRKELESAVIRAVSGYLSNHPDTLRTIEVKISSIDSSTKVHEVGKRWEAVSVQGESVGTLSRTMRSKAELAALSDGVSPFVRLLNLIGSLLAFFFRFITRSSHMPPVDINLLREVVGVFPQDGFVSMRQALTYWTRALEREATPSIETNQLVTELKECSSIAEQIERIRLSEGPKFDAAFHTLAKEVEDQIRAGGRHLVPTGFWRESSSDHQQPAFQDCLLEVSKTDGGRFKMALFSMEAGAQALITTHEIDEAQLARDIPLILALHFKPGEEVKSKTVQGLFSFFHRAKSVKQPTEEESPPITTSTQELEGLFGGEKSQSSERLSRYASAVRIAKKFVHHKMAGEQREYKTIRLRSEIDLLDQATSTDAWLASNEFRNTVFHSANKLLSDIVSLKKNARPCDRYGTTERTLELEREKLEGILDRVSAFAKTQAESSARESLVTTSFGSITLPQALSPKDVVGAKPISLSGIDVGPLSPKETLDTIDKVNAYLSEVSALCERLVREGQFDILEDAIPMIYTNLSLRKGAEPFFKGISEAQAGSLSESLAKVQKSICACHMARNQYVPGDLERGYGYFFHPDFWLAIPFLEAVHDQIAVELDPKKKPLPFFVNIEILPLLQEGPLSYLRSATVLRCFNEVMEYSNNRGAFSPLSLGLDSKDAQSKVLQEAQKMAIMGTLFLPHHVLFFREGVSELPPIDEEKIERDFNEKHAHTDASDPRAAEAKRAFFFGKRQEARIARGGNPLPVHVFPKWPKTAFQTLPVLEVRKHTYAGRCPETVQEFFLSPPGMFVDKALSKQEFTWRKESKRIPGLSFSAVSDVEDFKLLFVSGRVYSPPTPTSVPVDQTIPFFHERVSRVTGFDAALCRYAEEDHPLESVGAINEFNFLRKEFWLEEGKAPFSRDEVLAIQTLSSRPDKGGAEASIANMLKLSSYHPRLLSCPQVKLFIYRTILRPGIVDSKNVCQKMRTGLETLFLRMDEIRQKAHKTGDYGAEIHLISLLGALSARMPAESRMTIPLACHDWIGELKTLKGLVQQKASWQRLYHQEYLALVVAAGETLFAPQTLEREIGLILSSWLRINSDKGSVADTDPGVHKEARMLVLSLLSRMSSMADNEKKKILDFVASECLFPMATWDLTRFPVCQYGSVTIQIDTGEVWRNGATNSRLPQEVESGVLFSKMNLPKNRVWRLVQRVESRESSPVYVYTSDQVPNVRITTSLNGMQYSIQRMIDGVWCTAVLPRLEEKRKKEESVAKIVANTLRAESVANMLREESDVDLNVLTLNPALYSLVRQDVLYIQTPPSRPKIVTAKGLVIQLSQKGAVTSVRMGPKQYGMLGINGETVFSALDTRNVAIETGTMKKVLFPYLSLRDTHGVTKSLGITAQLSGTTWEYDDDSLRGYKLCGCQQPVPYTTTLHGGTAPIIPFGINSYHLLQNAKGQQKVLIPMRTLQLSFPQHAPGNESEAMKQFSRFLTLVHPKEFKRPDECSSVFCFDVVDGSLSSDDPLANAYLAYMYMTQQRYEDAKKYLEKSHTNLPDPALEKLYMKILKWPDASAAFESVKRKACLLQCEWPVQEVTKKQDQQRLTKDEIVQTILSPCSQAENKEECEHMVKALFHSMDQKDRIRFAFALRSYGNGISYGPSAPIEGAIVSQEPTAPEMTLDFARTLLKVARPEDERLPEQFLEELALHSDETLMKYFFPLLRLLEKGENLSVFEAVQNARVRMSAQVKELANLLLKLHGDVRTIRAEGDHEKIEALSRGEYEHFLHPVKKLFSSLKKPNLFTPEYDLLHAFHGVSSREPSPPAVPPQDDGKGEEEGAINQLPLERIRQLLEEVLPQIPVSKHAEVPMGSSAQEPSCAFDAKVTFGDALLPGKSSLSSGTLDTFFDAIDIKESPKRETLRKKRDDLRSDTLLYLNEEKKQKLFDPTKVPEVRNRLTTMEKELQSEKIKLRETIFFAVNRLPGSEVDKVRTALTPMREFIHFERLLGSYVKGDISDLLHRYKIEIGDISVLETNIQRYLQVSTALKQVQDTLEKIPPKKTSFSVNEQRKIGAMLEANRYFTVDGSQRSRLLLMLEYSSGFLLRKGNVELVDRLLSDPNCICQLPPGSGKTLVVLRLIAVMRANGTNLSSLILPEWLYEQNRRDLDLGLKQLFGQDICCLDVPEDRDLSVAELDELFIRLQQTVATKGVLLTTRLSLLTLRDSFKHLERQLVEEVHSENDAAKDTMARYTGMAKVIGLLKMKMQSLTDEADSIFDIHREVNRKEKEGDKLPKWQRATGCLLYSLLIDVMDDQTMLGRLARAIRDNTHVDLPRESVAEALNGWADRLLEYLHISEDRELVKNYLLQKPTDKVVHDLPKGVKARETLIAAKSFLSQALPLSTLTKACNTKDGYGRHQSMVIPYAGPDQPEKNSEFCNPFEMIAFSIQDYLHKGITEEQAKILASQINEQLNAEWLKKGGGLNKSGLEAGKQALSDFGIDVERLQRYEDEGEAALYVQQCINGNLRCRMNFCSRYVLPNIKTTKEQQRSDAFDLVDMMASSSGMTATPHNVRTYHDRISKERATTEGSDGKTVAAVLQHEVRLHFIPAKKTVSEYLVEHGASGVYQGIIDIGAYCKDKSPAALAVDMASKLPPDSKTQYIVYINREGKIVAFDRISGEVKDFDEKAMPPETRKTVYQIFIGADIKQETKAKFLVTVGNLNFLKDFIQGVMRLRELNEEQTFDLALTSDVAATIREVTGKTEGELLLSDVVAYCLDNELKATQEDTLAAEKRKIERVPAAAVFKATVAIAATLDPTSVKHRALLVEIHDVLHPLITVEPEFSVESLAGVQREENTSDTLKQLKQKTIGKLEKMLSLDVVKKNKVVRDELDAALTELRKREFTNPQYMPSTNMVRPGCEEIGQTAKAIQQQTTQTQAVAFERRVEAPTAKVPYWMSMFYDSINLLGMQLFGRKRSPSDEMHRLSAYDGYTIFDDSICVSGNIQRGWESGFYKDLAYAVYHPSTHSLFVVDKSDFRECLSNNYDAVFCVIGPEVSLVKMEKKRKKERYELLEPVPFKSDVREHSAFYRQVVQVKLAAGFIDFTSKEEREALERFVREKGRDQIEAFMEWNRDHYLSEASYARFLQGEGFLAEVLKRINQ